MDIDGRDAFDIVLDRLEERVEQLTRKNDRLLKLETDLRESQEEVKTLKEECVRLKAIAHPPAPPSSDVAEDIPF